MKPTRVFGISEYYIKPSSEGLMNCIAKSLRIYAILSLITLMKWLLLESNK